MSKHSITPNIRITIKWRLRDIPVRYGPYISDLMSAHQEQVEALIDEEVDRRKANLVFYAFELFPGNESRGARNSIKQVKGLTPRQGNGYDFAGSFVNEDGALPEGTLLLITGRDGSWRNSSYLAALVSIKRDAAFKIDSDYQAFSGTGAQLLATSEDEIDTQAMIDAYPSLGVFAGKSLAPIAYCYMQLRAKS